MTASRELELYKVDRGKYVQALFAVYENNLYQDGNPVDEESCKTVLFLVTIPKSGHEPIISANMYTLSNAY